MLQLHPLTLRDIPRILHWNLGTDADWLYQWAGKGYHWPLTAAQICQKMASGNHLFRIDEAGEMIGTIELAGFTVDKQSASICRFLIARQHRGQGLGHTALDLLCRHAATELGLCRLDLRVFDFNIPAITCYRKAAFREINHLPNAWRNASRNCGVLIMVRDLE